MKCGRRRPRLPPWHFEAHTDVEPVGAARAESNDTDAHRVARSGEAATNGAADKLA